MQNPRFMQSSRVNAASGGGSTWEVCSVLAAAAAALALALAVAAAAVALAFALALASAADA